MSQGIVAFRSAARAVGHTVDAIPRESWNRPGLGDWTVRDLVGHTSRALITVVDYLARPVLEEVIESAPAYLAAISTGTFEAQTVAERGRRAGHDLGDDPASRFTELVNAAIQSVEATDPDLSEADQKRSFGMSAGSCHKRSDAADTVQWAL